MKQHGHGWSCRKLKQYDWYRHTVYHMQCMAGGWIIIMSYKLCKWSESHWFRTQTAWGKKLLLILSVLALKQQYRLPDCSTEKSLLLEWWRSFMILSAPSWTWWCKCHVGLRVDIAFCWPHHPLQGQVVKVVNLSAAPKPGSDAACQDTLYGGGVESL